MNATIMKYAPLGAVLLLAAAPLAVRADLVYKNVGGTGLIYDTTDGTTWTQSGDYSGQTFTQAGAVAYVAGLTIPGVNASWELPDSTQLRTLFLQLDGSPNNYGPEVPFGSGPNDYVSNVHEQYYWTDTPNGDFNFAYGYGGYDANVNDLNYVWAIEQAPEPSGGVMSVLACGLLGGFLWLRRPAVRA